jgi:hypothetical protein
MELEYNGTYNISNKHGIRNPRQIALIFLVRVVRSKGVVIA